MSSLYWLHLSVQFCWLYCMLFGISSNLISTQHARLFTIQLPAFNHVFAMKQSYILLFLVSCLYLRRIPDVFQILILFNNL